VQNKNSRIGMVNIPYNRFFFGITQDDRIAHYRCRCGITFVATANAAAKNERKNRYQYARYSRPHNTFAARERKKSTQKNPSRNRSKQQ
jgi:uncharacterized protein YdaU (DUF1376 family)